MKSKKSQKHAHESKLKLSCALSPLSSAIPYYDIRLLMYSISLSVHGQCSGYVVCWMEFIDLDRLTYIHTSILIYIYVYICI